MADILIKIVDKNDKILGYKTKKECHRGKGILHRAFSVFVFNCRGELLLQKRSQKKLLWPAFWSNSCCSHFKKGEKEKKVIEKRLKEELGFSCPLNFLSKFYYQAYYEKKGVEKEIIYIFVGRYDGKVIPNKDEVADYKWINLDWLRKDIKKKPNLYTPWLKLIVKRLGKKFYE